VQVEAGAVAVGVVVAALYVVPIGALLSMRSVPAERWEAAAESQIVWVALSVGALLVPLLVVAPAWFLVVVRPRLKAARSVG
jgi:hypothetical protein